MDSCYHLPLIQPRSNRGIATTPEVEAMLAANSPVAIGVSGGKDSSAVAFATVEYLNRIGHKGPRLLIHADLGVTEWAASLPNCQRLAERLGLELVVVRRKQGDMMQRWEQRWSDNARRWETLSCVKLILPWSTPAMRFCTSEMKIAQICAYLVRRFAGQKILSVTGIRREESTERKKAPIAAQQKKLTSKTLRTTGLNWNPTIEWLIGDVFGSLEERAFPLHEAYTVYGSSRVSCVYCILATREDHEAGARDERNHALARRMIALEIRSTFAFQGNRWLADTLTHLLAEAEVPGVLHAKKCGEMREQAEKRIPKHLLYSKGWPTCVPTRDEATILASVRMEVALLVKLRPTFTDPDEIIVRYQELIALKEAKAAKKPKRS